MDWPGGSWEATALLVGTVVGGYFAVLWAGLLVWTYLDIRSRTRLIAVHVGAVLLVLVLNLAGLLVYLMLRPKETLAEAYDRSLEEEALLTELQDRQVCPQCGQPIRDDYLVCPHCTAELRQPCVACGKPLTNTWVVCPFCGVSRRPAVARRAAPRRAPAAAIADEAPASTASAFSAIIGDRGHAAAADDSAPELVGEPAERPGGP